MGMKFSLPDLFILHCTNQEGSHEAGKVMVAGAPGCSCNGGLSLREGWVSCSQWVVTI